MNTRGQQDRKLKIQITHGGMIRISTWKGRRSCLLFNVFHLREENNLAHLGSKTNILCHSTDPVALKEPIAAAIGSYDFEMQLIAQRVVSSTFKSTTFQSHSPHKQLGLKSRSTEGDYSPPCKADPWSPTPVLCDL